MLIECKLSIAGALQSSLILPLLGSSVLPIKPRSVACQCLQACQTLSTACAAADDECWLSDAKLVQGRAGLWVMMSVLCSSVSIKPCSAACQCLQACQTLSMACSADNCWLYVAERMQVLGCIQADRLNNLLKPSMARQLSWVMPKESFSKKGDQLLQCTCLSSSLYKLKLDELRVQPLQQKALWHLLAPSQLAHIPLPAQQRVSWYS